jgi:putative endonuclease
VYILQNADGRPYVGSTGRLAEHNAGLNRWTRLRRPWRLAYSEVHDSKGKALARERFLKTGVGRHIRDALIGAKSVAATTCSVG